MSFPIALFLGIGAIALFSFIAVAVWADSRRREREALYKNESLRKIAGMEGEGAASVLEYLRQEERNAAWRQREGIKLGGLVTTAAGVGLMIFLRAFITDEPVYLAGLIPLLVGAALLTYIYLLAPRA